MTDITGILVSTDGFKKLTGTDFTYFAEHVLRGDAWASFLKIAGVIEGSSKRAIGVRLGLDPSSKNIARLEFYSAILLCREMQLISEEAFGFANYVRQARNDLVHGGGVLHLAVEQLGDSGFAKRYRERVQAFVSIEGKSLEQGEREHLDTLLAGCIAFLAALSKSLFDEDWLQPVLGRS